MGAWVQAWGDAWGNAWGGEAGVIPGSTARPIGHSKGRKLRLSVNINGEHVLVNSVEEAQALLKAQAHPKERAKRRRKQRARILERLRPDISVSDQVDAIGDHFGEVADAAARNAEVVRLFNDAVAEQSIRALGALRLGIENAQEEPPALVMPPEIRLTDDEREMVDGLMRQIGVFDEALGFFMRGISEMEREAYREMDALMRERNTRYDALKRDEMERGGFNEVMQAWAEEVNKRNTDRYNERIAKKRKRFDVFKKVFK